MDKVYITMFGTYPVFRTDINGLVSDFLELINCIETLQNK